MHRDHKGDVRAFTRLSKAWYGTNELRLRTDITEEFLIGLYSPDEGTTSGEFKVTWERVGAVPVPALNFHAFDDGWSALQQFDDLLKAMAARDDDSIGPDAFEALLLALGIEDQTPPEKPH